MIVSAKWDNVELKPGIIYSHSWHCFTCHHTQNSGLNSLTNSITAGKHCRERPGHQVATLESKIIHVFSAHNQPKLLDDVPPF